MLKVKWDKKRNPVIKNEDIEKMVDEQDVKDGFIEIFRVKRTAKNRPMQYSVAERPLNDIKSARIEDLLSEDYGGGEYFVRLFKVDDRGQTCIANFTYLIDGPQGADDDSATDPFKQLAIDVAKKQMLGGGSDSNTILLKIVETLLVNNNNLLMNINSQRPNNDLSDQLDNLSKLKSLTASDVPVIPPENETVALITAAASIGSAFLNSRNNQSQPIVSPRALTEMPLPNNPSLIMPSQPNANLDINLSGNNGNQPEFVTPQKAFATFFLKPYKEAVEQGAGNDEIVGMIESMTVNCIYWSRPDEYHEVVKVFVDGYSQTDLAKINQGFETIMTYGGIAKERAEIIKGLLLSLYQSRYATSDKAKNQEEGADKAKNQEEGAEDVAA